MSEYEVVGVSKRFTYTDKRTKAIVGARTLFVIFPDKSVDGYACDKIFASDSILGDYSPAVGDHINLIYGRSYSGNAYLTAIEPIK